MLKRINCKNIVSLFLSDEADTGTGGDQPARNNLTEWNGKRGGKISRHPFFYSSRLCLKKRFASIEARKQQQVLTRKKVNVFWDKTRQRGGRRTTE